VEHHERPQLNVPTLDARWFLLSQVDGVTVTTADGRGVVYRKRDPRQALGLFKEAMRLRKELAARFPEMQQRYRAAHPELTSTAAWENVFGVRAERTGSAAAEPPSSAATEAGRTGARPGDIDSKGEQQ
jgi:galactofuranosylgalactofuranosylrhamnosyl-N-acetylglucosaminyl-diphospho-decaprenol beta-1,5/1,6-galactofuranosyltransferase